MEFTLALEFTFSSQRTYYFFHEKRLLTDDFVQYKKESNGFDRLL